MATFGASRQETTCRILEAPEDELFAQLIVLDEPVSALDVSVRAGLINLLGDL